MTDDRRTYRIEQLGRPQHNGVQYNEEVASLEGLVTHHPGGNRNIRMREGSILRAENPARRSHAYISGDFEEVINGRVDRYDTLQPDQVLLVKDFILEDPQPPRGTSARAVDIPSPASGYVNSVRANAGFVEIMDREGGTVIARLRHMSNIAVEPGDTVSYGESLGQQDNLGLNRPAGVGMHVHIEMDTGHYQQFQSYMADLANGRLPVQAEYRENVQPLPIVNDGTFRLGQSNERVRDLQRVMADEGYLATGGGALDQDGVYRPGMQGALLDFQRAHGLPQTGDIDPATLRMAPLVEPRLVDHQDVFVPGRPMPAQPATQPTAPGHPGHPDHRQNLTAPLPPPVNRQAPGSGRSPGDPGHPDHAMLQQIREAVHRIDDGIGKPHDEASERMSRCLLVQCREAGLRRVDHVVMGTNGTNLFAVEGQLNDPAHLRTHVATGQAIRTPLEQSDERLLVATRAAAPRQQESVQQRDPARGPDDPGRSGPIMQM